MLSNDHTAALAPVLEVLRNTHRKGGIQTQAFCACGNATGGPTGTPACKTIHDFCRYVTALEHLRIQADCLLRLRPVHEQHFPAPVKNALDELGLTIRDADRVWGQIIEDKTP